MNLLLKFRGDRLSRSLGRSLAIGASLFLATGSPAQEQVDSELLLLVDTSFVMNGAEFSALMDSYATAFESASVIDALQAGDRGRIAVSMAFFGGVGTPNLVLPWTSVSDAVSAQALATAIRNVVRPVPLGAGSIVDAVSYATQQFGTETGNPTQNGFASSTQAINLATESFTLSYFTDAPAATAAATDAAIAAGVDVINGMVIGTGFAGPATTFYNNNIVGGAAGDEPGAVSNAPTYGALASQVPSVLGGQIFNLVPEPSSAMLVLIGMAGLLRRRRN